MTDQLMEGLYARETDILFARMMGRTNTAIVTFKSLSVPRFICYDGGEYRCYTHRPKQQVCGACLEVGHLVDVCPTLNAAAVGPVVDLTHRTNRTHVSPSESTAPGIIPPRTRNDRPAYDPPPHNKRRSNHQPGPFKAGSPRRVEAFTGPAHATDHDPPGQPKTLQWQVPNPTPAEAAASAKNQTDYPNPRKRTRSRSSSTNQRKELPEGSPRDSNDAHTSKVSWTGPSPPNPPHPCTQSTARQPTPSFAEIAASASEVPPHRPPAPLQI
ncbi:hypothetical protein HPB47_019136 [Ixodes persulcatus]|uniref:Uncharacterized protein n=1 Tax=Ixodes persulcatus TaxID=34615 RepID=A0AC60QMK9_IXOPE|nr:hypothetical protein HPB47_019136 [Ixodes persulcatus]